VKAAARSYPSAEARIAPTRIHASCLGVEVYALTPGARRLTDAYRQAWVQRPESLSRR